MSGKPVVGFVAFWVVFGVCMLVALTLFSLNGWREMDQWSLGSKLLGAVVLVVPFVALMLTDAPASNTKARNERIQKAIARDPGLKELQRQVEAPDRGTMKWVFGGAIPSFVLAILIARDPNLGPVLGAPAFIGLPFIGAGIGFWFSPAMRAEREFRAGIEAAEARQRESTEERYQRERVAENWQGAQSEWRKRVYDALLWWSSEGDKLNSDSEFLLALVHQRRGAGLAGEDEMIARYQNPNDPCSTWQRAEQVATWASANLPDLIADHLPEARRTVAGVTEVLRHHHRREVVFHQEARAFALDAAVEARREESPEHLVERILKESDAVALAREKGMKRIGEVAATMRPEAREHYIRATTAGVNALLEAWLFARIDKVR